jgi:hypothetical protein
MKKFILSLLFTGASLSGFAQVEHKKEWSPVHEVQATAPTPPHLKERVRAFEERNSDQAVSQLANDLFGLMSADYIPENAAQAELYQKAWVEFRGGKFREALESYKLYVFQYMRNPGTGVNLDPRDPANRTFIEFYNQADELMRGIFRLQVFDQPIPADVVVNGTDAVINYYRAGKQNAHMVDVILQNGMPGRMNWTYVVPGYFSGTWHIKDEKAFAATAYRQNMCFAPLLVSYLEKKDPANLNQWAAYIDDMLLNYRHDLVEAGIVMNVTPSGADGPYYPHLIYLAIHAPNVDQDFPATTFARLQLRYWEEDLPLIKIGSRATGANRAMEMYGSLFVGARKRFPELAEVKNLLTDRRRILESYAREYMMPDGTSVDYAPNYNKNFINCPPADIKYLQGMNNPPAWFTPEWVAQLQRDRMLMARYLVHTIAPDGTLPGYKDPIRNLGAYTVGEKGYLIKSLPEALSDPVNKGVIGHLLGKPDAADPGYTSEAFPYGGYYVMRENWSPEGRYLYFHDYRTAENGNWRHRKNIYVQAFGQRMLTGFRWESPLLVDGAGQMFGPFLDLYPKSYAGQRALVGTHAEHSAYQDPIPSRWFTSPQFDLTEGNLKVPFAQKFDDKPSVFVDDVAHGRQVIFLRGAGAWIVTDRITAEKSHDYKILWGFDADRINPPGWDKDWRNKNKKAEAPNENAYSKDQIVIDPAAQSIRTENPKRPNLSIYQAASLPITLKPGDIEQNNDSMFGNSYRTGPSFHTQHAAVVASLLYPRRTGAPDVTSFKSVAVANGAGFDAITPEGFHIQYRAELTAQDLNAGTVKAKASTLVLSQSPDKVRSGIALDCASFAADGKTVSVPSADFEFTIAQDGKVSFAKIERPMGVVKILPESDVFLGSEDVTFEPPAKDVYIRYTLDGSEPTLASPVFDQPIRLNKTTTVRAIAVRKGVTSLPVTTDSTLASISATAVFTKAPSLWPAAKETGLQPGLAFQYFEDDWTLSLLKLPILKPVQKGVVKTWMDISAVQNNENSYALVYEGYLKVPSDGVYTFHAPWEFVDIGERVAYDLQITVDGHVWYPTTRAHNYGNWSIPLAAGAHAIRVSYVDIRRGAQQASYVNSFQGEKPEVRISGPNLSVQAVPADWLLHQP